MPRIIEVGGKRTTWLGRMLSNFAFSQFVLDLNRYSTTEGFWQGLKWPGDLVERQECFGTLGWEAKKLGARAPKSTSFDFMGKSYEVGSPEHLGLMKRAIKAKIEQNPRLLKEFLDSGDAEFTHPVKEKRSTVLTNKVFLQMLVEIREELRRGQEERQEEEGGEARSD